MPTLMSGSHTGQRLSALAASSLTTSAGGAMDAWVYLAHGHVFATAQSGNVVLLSVALASGDVARAVTHLPSLLAFITGLLASRESGELFKRRRLNSRNIRLGLECVMLVALALLAHRMSDRAVTACVGFIAGVQIASLSHIGSWSFNRFCQRTCHCDPRGSGYNPHSMREWGACAVRNARRRASTNGLSEQRKGIGGSAV
jgi:hypothetical protein